MIRSILISAVFLCVNTFINAQVFDNTPISIDIPLCEIPISRVSNPISIPYQFKNKDGNKRSLDFTINYLANDCDKFWHISWKDLYNLAGTSKSSVWLCDVYLVRCTWKYSKYRCKSLLVKRLCPKCWRICWPSKILFLGQSNWWSGKNNSSICTCRTCRQYQFRSCGYKRIIQCF